MRAEPSEREELLAPGFAGRVLRRAKAERSLRASRRVGLGVGAAVVLAVVMLRTVGQPAATRRPPSAELATNDLGAGANDDLFESASEEDPGAYFFPDAPSLATAEEERAADDIGDMGE